MYATDAVKQGIQTHIKPSVNPSCFDCQNCEIINIGQENEFWDCETVGWVVPCRCDPPYDEPCRFFNRDERFDNDVFMEVITRIQEHMDD